MTSEHLGRNDELWKHLHVPILWNYLQWINHYSSCGNFWDDTCWNSVWNCNELQHSIAKWNVLPARSLPIPWPAHVSLGIHMLTYQVKLAQLGEYLFELGVTSCKTTSRGACENLFCLIGDGSQLSLDNLPQNYWTEVSKWRKTKVTLCIVFLLRGSLSSLSIYCINYSMKGVVCNTMWFSIFHLTVYNLVAHW
jgi:hypothetical protein